MPRSIVSASDREKSGTGYIAAPLSVSELAEVTDSSPVTDGGGSDGPSVTSLSADELTALRASGPSVTRLQAEELAAGAGATGRITALTAAELDGITKRAETGSVVPLEASELASGFAPTVRIARPSGAGTSGMQTSGAQTSGASSHGGPVDAELRQSSATTEATPGRAGDEAEDWFEQGVRAELREEHDTARASFRAAIRRDPIETRYRLALAQSLMHDERLVKEAESELLEARGIEPKNAALAFALGDVYKTARLRERAIRLYRQTLSLEPQHHGARRELWALEQPATSSPLEELDSTVEQAASTSWLERLRRRANDKPVTPGRTSA